MCRPDIQAADTKPLVTITGVSGFLGSQTCLVFLKDGKYRVRGTVRNVSNPAKIDPLRKAFGKYFEQLELVEADLLDEQSIVNAIAGSTYVIHTASPFYFTQQTKEELIKPAVNGTLAVMKACQQHGTVKRVVITSSVAAVASVADEDKPKNGALFDETYWSNPDRPGGISPYFESKTLAERAAWEFQAALPESEKFEIATINPVFVMGPSICAGDGTSEAWMASALDGSKTKIPGGATSFVDVRDCAIAHLRAMEIPEAANKRFLLVEGQHYAKEAYEILAAKYNPQGYKVPTEEEPRRPADIANSNERSRKVLGIEYIPFATTVTDMVDSMIAAGKIKVKA